MDDIIGHKVQHRDRVSAIKGSIIAIQQFRAHQNPSVFGGDRDPEAIKFGGQGNLA